MKSYGLALAGGGTKGAYQMGVWRAIRELQIPISAIVGTSIGALNGAMFAQGDYEAVNAVWNSMSIERIFKTKAALADEKRLTGPKNILPLLTEMLSNNGLDVTPLRELMQEIIDEETLRSAETDFGLVTFSVSDLKPIEIFKKDIPQGQIVDYILASACLPGFKSAVIDSKNYADGGITNNMPVSMLVERGIKDVIAVDVGGIGFVKNFDSEAVNVIHISPKISLGSMLEFDPDVTHRNIQLGYYDTLKAFGRVSGSYYYFAPREYDKLKMEFSHTNIQGLQQAALFYDIRRDIIYTAKSFLDALFSIQSEKYLQFEEIRSSFSKKSVVNDLASGKLKLDAAVKIPLICDVLESKWLGNVTNKLVKRLLPKEYLAANALLVLKRSY